MSRNFNLKIKKENLFDLIRTSSNNNERKPLSAFPASYGHHYNQNRELTKTSI